MDTEITEEVKKEVSTKVDGFSNEEEIQKSAMSSIISQNNTRVKPNIFMSKNERVKIEVEILSDPITGKILSVYKKDSFPVGELGEILVKTQEWFEFSIPSYDDVSLYRQKSARYPNKETVIDTNLFRNFILGLHLKDWSLKDKDDNKIELDFDVDETLSKKSADYINQIPTIIWDVVLTAFERETLIM